MIAGAGVLATIGIMANSKGKKIDEPLDAVSEFLPMSDYRKTSIVKADTGKRWRRVRGNHPRIGLGWLDLPPRRLI
jgi:hypothetical protein